MKKNCGEQDIIVIEIITRNIPECTCRRIQCKLIFHVETSFFNLYQIILRHIVNIILFFHQNIIVFIRSLAKKFNESSMKLYPFLKNFLLNFFHLDVILTIVFSYFQMSQLSYTLMFS